MLICLHFANIFKEKFRQIEVIQFLTHLFASFLKNGANCHNLIILVMQNRFDKLYKVQYWKITPFCAMVISCIVCV